jgi:hypothetical protein
LIVIIALAQFRSGVRLHLFFYLRVAPASDLRVHQRAPNTGLSDSELGSEAEISDKDSVDLDHEEDKSSEPGSRSSSPPPPVEITPARGTKRKVSMMDQITELANEDCSQRLKMIEVKQREKTRRLQAKYQTQNELELARMRHQEQQGALQRQHDLVMMERQMDLEHLRSTAAYPQAQLAPGAYPGPPYGGHFGIDPNLSYDHCIIFSFILLFGDHINCKSSIYNYQKFICSNSSSFSISLLIFP